VCWNILVCNSSYARGIGRRNVVQGWPWQKAWAPIWYITKAVRAGVMAQVLEHPPGKHKALSSNPYTPTPKKKNCCPLPNSEEWWWGRMGVAKRHVGPQAKNARQWKGLRSHAKHGPVGSNQGHRTVRGMELQISRLNAKYVEWGGWGLRIIWKPRLLGMAAGDTEVEGQWEATVNTDTEGQCGLMRWGQKIAVWRRKPE
jgi:hypothetical protein